MPSLRAGRLKYEPDSAITRSITSRIWHEPPIANDSTAAMNGFSRRSSSSAPRFAEVVPAVHLRQRADLPLEHELDERDLPVVEVGQVQARAEDPPPGVLGMDRDSAAQHGDPDRVVEEHEVDRRLERRDRRVVLGVQERVVLGRDDPDLALAVDADDAEVRGPGPPEAVDAVERLRLRLRHRVQQMRAAARVGEHVGEEDPLLDLEALLVLLQQLALGVDRGAGRQQVGVALGRGVDELGHAQRPCAPVGELVVDRLGLGAEPRLALGAGLGGRRQRVGHGGLPSVGRAASEAATSGRAASETAASERAASEAVASGRAASETATSGARQARAERRRAAPSRARHHRLAPFPVRRPQLALEQLAGARFRQRLAADLDALGHLVAGDRRPAMGDQVVLAPRPRAARRPRAPPRPSARPVPRTPPPPSTAGWRYRTSSTSVEYTFSPPDTIMSFARSTRYR